MRVEGRVVVVTGGSMGIGEEIARLFFSKGAKVVLAGREMGRLEEARQRIGGTEPNSLCVECDVRSRDQLESLMRTALGHFERVDVWVNNAGFGLVDSVEKMDMAECRGMFDTNLFGAIEGMQVAIPVMRRQGFGAIINISSVAGYIAVPYMAAYGATKHALNCFSRAARLELRGTGVKVINVCPGYVKTGFGEHVVRGRDNRSIGSGVKRGITPQRVAQAVWHAYVLGSRDLVVPWNNEIAIAFYRALPSLVEWVMMKMLRGIEKKTA